MATDDEQLEEVYKEIDEANKAWHKRWPNACKCEGAGGYGYVEMHGFKHGAGEHMWDTCTCVLDGFCPRCNARVWPEDMEDEWPCPECGWNWGKGKDDAAPQI